MLDKEKIVELYKSGLSPFSISKILGTYNTSIRRVLLKAGFKLKNQSEALITTSVDLFKNEEDEESQYWLGMIAADGTIGKKDNLINLGLQEKDLKHLEKYAKFVKKKVSKVFNKKFQINEFRVNFKNKEVNRYLKSIGITDNKSKTIVYLKPITRHFLRGVLDGDGYVKANKPVIEIASASIEFLKQLQYYLNSNNVHCIINTRKDKMNILGIYKKEEVKKFYNLIYTDASVFLERKKDRLDAFFLGNLKDTTSSNSVN